MNFGEIKNVCLIGGGEPMVHFAKYLISINIDVSAILAPRHAQNKLPLSGLLQTQALTDIGVTYCVVDDINEKTTIETQIKSKNYDLAVCFGPAWIFSEPVRSAFNLRMVNFHPVPIPRYLGAAHYTWQILNGDKLAGAALQHINERVNKGDLVKSAQHMLSDDARIPQDYFEANFQIQCSFLEEFADELLANKNFDCKSWFSEEIQQNKMYFPRLITEEQAFIDWSWSGSDIERFCNAFDRPYRGSSSFVNGNRVFLRAVNFISDECEFHPFCRGLVSRKTNDTVFICVNGGFLKTENIFDIQKNNIVSRIREGMRFFTPNNQIEHAINFTPVIGSEPPKVLVGN